MQLVNLLLYISDRNLKKQAMLAFASILGIILPISEVIRLVAPGPLSAVTQFVRTTLPKEIAPYARYMKAY